MVSYSKASHRHSPRSAGGQSEAPFLLGVPHSLSIAKDSVQRIISTCGRNDTANSERLEYFLPVPAGIGESPLWRQRAPGVNPAIRLRGLSSNAMALDQTLCSKGVSGPLLEPRNRGVADTIRSAYVG
jgi:hypothetical protein